MVTEEFKLIEERLPHVYSKLKLFWGTEFFHEYTDNLMFDTRDGQRKGFPNELAKALYNIIKEHDSLYPRKPHSDIWTRAYYD